MDSKSSIIRIVHKDNYNEQYLFDLPHSTLPPLEDGWVRMQNRLITIASYNLSYCALGRLVHWWDCFPVPLSLPAPYNDREQYGISPSWGINEVIESNNPDLPVGTALYGHSPTSAFPFDLCFTKSSNISGHFLEVSEQRKKVMAIYQRFITIDGGLMPENEQSSAQLLAFRIPHECGYLLNRFVFAHRPEDTQIHPFPELKTPWSVEEANLKYAVIIALGAGGRSCRAFLQQLATNREPGSGPTGVVEITSRTTSLLTGTKTPFKHHVLKYEDALSPKLIEWITQIDPKRIVLLDYGGRNNINAIMSERLRQTLPSVTLSLIGIGREADFKAIKASATNPLAGTRMNTSGIGVAASEQHGEANYFQEADEAYDKMIESERKRVGPNGNVMDVKVTMKDGIKGQDGFEQAWIDLCNGRLDGGEALVFRI